MSVTRFTPSGMMQPTPYHHVAVGQGSRHIHVSGQIARNEDGSAIAENHLAGQVAQALRNTAIGLAGAGKYRFEIGGGRGNRRPSEGCSARERPGRYFSNQVRRTSARKGRWLWRRREPRDALG